MYEPSTNEYDNAVDMQVKYIKTKCTELQERVGQDGQGSSIFAAIFYCGNCNRCDHFSLKHIIFCTVPFSLGQFLIFCAKSLAKCKKLSKNLVNI